MTRPKALRNVISSIGLAAAVLSATPTEAQISPDVWRAYEEKIKPAVYCIRTTALYEQPVYSSIDGTLTSGFKEQVWHGSGMALPEMVERNGRMEYRILTNNHVVNAEPFDGGARLVKVTYALVDNNDDNDPSDDVAAQKDIQNPDLDQAILVTVNAPEIAVASIAQLGAASELQQGDRLLTTGFPNAITKTSVDGTLSSNEYDDAQVLPYPGSVYSANIPIDPGQSGSPVVRPIIRDDNRVEFELVGLVYAKNPFSDQIRLITPIEEGNATLAARENIPSQRPSLTAIVDDAVLSRLSEDGAGITRLYDIDDYKAVVRKRDDGTYALRHFRQKGDVILQNEMIDFLVSPSPTGGVTITGIVSTKDAVTKEYAVSPDRQQRFDKYVNAVLNHFAVQRELTERASATVSSSEQTRFASYYQSVVKEQAKELAVDSWLVFSQLYSDGVISKQFW